MERQGKERRGRRKIGKEGEEEERGGDKIEKGRWSRSKKRGQW